MGNKRTVNFENHRIKSEVVRGRKFSLYLMNYFAIFKVIFYVSFGHPWQEASLIKGGLKNGVPGALPPVLQENLVRNCIK